MAAIWASAVLIGRPARSRAATIGTVMVDMLVPPLSLTAMPAVGAIDKHSCAALRE